MEIDPKALETAAVGLNGWVADADKTPPARSVVERYLTAIGETHVMAPRDLMHKAHAVMRECGWQLAVGAEPQGDGVLEAACTEIEADFAEFLAAVKEGE